MDGNGLTTVIGILVIAGAIGAVIALYLCCSRRIERIAASRFSSLRQIRRELGDESSGDN